MSVEVDKAAELFGALASPVRLRILQLISTTKRPLHIKAVARQLSKDYSTVYRHVETLFQVGLIEIFDVGRSRVITVKEPERLKQIMAVADIS